MKFDATKMTKTAKTLDDEKRRMIKAATRVNKHAPAHCHAIQRDPAIVASPTFSRLMEKDKYRTGDGDTAVVIRPGSLDFKKCLSVGIG
jgi:hypothetical protein